MSPIYQYKCRICKQVKDISTNMDHKKPKCCNQTMTRVYTPPTLSRAATPSKGV